MVSLKRNNSSNEGKNNHKTASSAAAQQAGSRASYWPASSGDFGAMGPFLESVPQKWQLQAGG